MDLCILLNHHFYRPKLIHQRRKKERKKKTISTLIVDPMSHNSQASGSSPPSSPFKKIAYKTMAEQVGFLLNGDHKQLREQVESVKNVNILIFYSRVIFTALEAINALVNKLKTQNLFPVVEDADVLSLEPFAYEYFFKEACDIAKEIRKMFSNAISTRSLAKKRGGGSQKVQKWKNQCEKNLEKIEFLIKDTFLRDYHTWFDVFAMYGIYDAVDFVLVNSYDILKSMESEDDEKYKYRAEGTLENYETVYREMTCARLDRIVEKVKGHNELVEAAKLRGPQAEQEALRKFQEDDDVLKIIQEECTAEELQEAKGLKKLEEMETLMETHEADFQKKLQNLVLKNKLLKAETEQKKLQEVETQKKLQEEDALKKLQEEETLKKLQEEESPRKLQEEVWQKKSQEDEAPLKKLEGGAALKKIQEEETQKTSQEAENTKESLNAEINKKVLEDQEELKKLEEEANSEAEAEIMIYKFGDMTFKMKNGVLERVLE